MSLAVIFYQIIIGGIIVLSAKLWGRKALGLATIIAIIWTIMHIFVMWLMILQFITIIVAYNIGKGFIKTEAIQIEYDKKED